VLAAFALGFATAIPFILRRPAIYEVAISCGAAFMMLALYLVFRGLFRGGAPSLRALAGASLCVGLAFDARPPMIVGGAVLLGAAVVLWSREDTPAAARRRITLALLGPLVVCVLLTFLYNDVRFGSPAQFGVSYQLAGVDQQTRPTFELAYLPPGLYNYLLAPPRVALTFPHVFLRPPPLTRGRFRPATPVAPRRRSTLPSRPAGSSPRRRSSCSSSQPRSCGAVAARGAASLR
jgi:4-amino-4-deoxy-L-arabinose transferase-like glycosyltransferase